MFNIKMFGVIVALAFIFISVECQGFFPHLGFMSGWADNFQSEMHNFEKQLSRDLEEQGRLIEQQTKRYVEGARLAERKKQLELQKQQEELMQIVRKIERGEIPFGVNSAKTNTIIEKVNGREINIKTTTFSTGNDNNGIIRTVQSTYDGSNLIDWSVNSLRWNDGKLVKRLIQRSPPLNNNILGNGHSVFINSNRGSVIKAEGTSFTSSNEGGFLIQELTL